MYLALFFGWGFAWSQIGVQVSTRDILVFFLIGYICWFSPGVPAEVGRALGTLISAFVKGLVPSWPSS